MITPASTPSSAASAHTSNETHSSSRIPAAPTSPPSSAVAFLDEIDPDSLGLEFEREDPGWFAVPNPKLKPMLDVSLLHTFEYER